MLVPILGAAAAKPVPVAGKWSGKVTDTYGDGSTYKAEASIRSKLVKGKSGGSIDYPKFDCGGKLIYLRHKGASYFFDENLTHGKDACIDGGVDRFRRVGKKLDYLWTGPNWTDTAAGDLRRN